MSNPMSQVYKNVFFRNKIGIPTILSKGIPSFRTILAEMCYLYRRTRPTWNRAVMASIHSFSGGALRFLFGAALSTRGNPLLAPFSRRQLPVFGSDRPGRLLVNVLLQRVPYRQHQRVRRVGS